ncbi:MAG: mechanosensitive ion channel, partial [Ginsengibacter sp.]
MDVNKAYHLISDKLVMWLNELIKMLPNILLAAIVLVLGFFLARSIKRFSAKIIKKFSDNDTLNGLFASVIHIFFIGIILFIALTVLQLNKAVVSILAGAGVIGLALAFAFQDIAANFISGIFISFRKPLHVGDIVKLKNYMGKVEEINLRDTVIRTFQGQMVIIPNKEVFQNPIENYSLLGKRRFDLTIRVSFGDDLEKVKKVTLDSLAGMKGILSPDDVTFYYNEIGDSAINYALRIWIDSSEQP